jgi:hypothetical protein
MTISWKDNCKQLDTLKSWQKDLESNSGNHALMDELQNRFSAIETLLAEEVTAAETDPEANPISMNEMQIIYNLNRCEAIKELIENGTMHPDRNIVNRLLYPNLNTICLQKLIRCIMRFKKRLKLKYNDYTVVSIWQTSYIIYPAVLTKFLSRLVTYIRASCR